MTPNLLARFVGSVGASTPAQQLVDIPMWFALFSADALAAPDPLTIEIGSGAYSRPVAVWEQYGDTGLVCVTTLFSSIPAGAHIACVGLFDAAVNGNLLAADIITDPDTGAPVPVDLPLGGSWVLPTGEFFLGFDLTGL